MMTSFSTIPKEIIEYMLPFVLPEDLENFAQCCKDVHEQASREKSNGGLSILQEHRSSIQKYFTLNDLEDVGPFLKALAANRHVARYVRKMNFGPLRKDVNVDGWGIQDVLANEEIFDILLEAAKTIGMHNILDSYLSKTAVHEPRERRECTNLMACSNTDVAIALFLPLLPNLSSLSFCWSWQGDNEHWYRIVADPAPLKLEDVGVLSKDRGHTITDIVRMAAPPCLHSLAIWNPDTSMNQGAQFLWAQRQFSPPNTVKELRLRQVDITDPVFFDYVGSLQGLESFYFRGSIRKPEDCDLTSLFAVLPSRYGNTLTKLSFHTYSYLTVPKLVFNKLNNLKELDVDWPMLLPDPYVAKKNWARWLPQSLEKLTIHDFGEDVMDWTAQFVSKRYQPVVDDVISHKAAGRLGVKEFSFTAEYGLFYSEDAHIDLSGFDEVARGFHNDCLPAGIRFSFENYED